VFIFPPLSFSHKRVAVKTQEKVESMCVTKPTSAKVSALERGRRQGRNASPDSKAASSSPGGNPPCVSARAHHSGYTWFCVYLYLYGYICVYRAILDPGVWQPSCGETCILSSYFVSLTMWSICVFLLQPLKVSPSRRRRRRRSDRRLPDTSGRPGGRHAARPRRGREVGR